MATRLRREPRSVAKALKCAESGALVLSLFVLLLGTNARKCLGDACCRAWTPRRWIGAQASQGARISMMRAGKVSEILLESIADAMTGSRKVAKHWTPLFVPTGCWHGMVERWPSMQSVRH
jgi:hypothetical protein